MAAVPVAVEPVAVRAPPAIAEVDVTHIQVAVRVAVNAGPEKNVTSVTIIVLLPVLGDQVQVLKEGIQQVRVEHRLAGQFFAKFMAAMPLVAFLTLGQVQNDLAAIHIQPISPLCDNDPSLADVLLDFCSVKWKLRRSSEIHCYGGLVDNNASDILAHRLDLGSAIKNALDTNKIAVLLQLGDFVGSKSLYLQRITELVHLTDRIESGHRPSPSGLVPCETCPLCCLVLAFATARNPESAGGESRDFLLWPSYKLAY